MEIVYWILNIFSLFVFPKIALLLINMVFVIFVRMDILMKMVIVKVQLIIVFHTANKEYVISVKNIIH